MFWVTAFRARADRTVAAGRILLSSTSLIAIWLDPTQPTWFQGEAYTMLAAYTLYALFVAAFVWRSEMPSERGALLRHVADLVVFTGIMYLTDGPTSPFFVFLAFALLSGTLHWHWHGATWTALACVVIVIGLGVADIIDTTDPGLGFKTVVTRLVYLSVAAVMLAWLGAHQERARAELWRLVEHAPAVPTAAGWPSREALDYAAKVLQAPRLLLVWSDVEEPWTFLALREGGTHREERIAPARFEPWVSEPLCDISFMNSHAGEQDTLVHRGLGRFERWSGQNAGIHPKLLTEFAIRSFVTNPIRSGDLEARLFLLDIPNVGVNDVLIAEVVAEQLKALFEQAQLLRELRAAAAVEERMRIARDLHDGVLQSLAGTALQLRSVMSLVGKSPREAYDRLASVQDGLASEQRDLRSFIRALEPGTEMRTTPENEGGELAAQLSPLAERLGRQWGVAFQWVLLPEGARLDPPSATYDVWRIIAEATANAVRHGGAKVVDVTVRVENGAVAIEIKDDGRGFPFTGRLDDAELAARRLGPRSLRARAAARGGQLTVESSPAGARLTVLIPLAEAAAA